MTALTNEQRARRIIRNENIKNIAILALMGSMLLPFGYGYARTVCGEDISNHVCVVKIAKFFL